MSRYWDCPADYMKESAVRCHRSLMHPRAALHRLVSKQATARLLPESPPRRYVYAVIDSVNTLAYGSAMLNLPAVEANRNRFDGVAHAAVSG